MDIFSSTWHARHSLTRFDPGGKFPLSLQYPTDVKFRTQLEAFRVSCHTEKFWYNETVCRWMAIYIYIYVCVCVCVWRNSLMCFLSFDHSLILLVEFSVATPAPLSEGLRITMSFLDKSLNAAMCPRGKTRSSNTRERSYTWTDHSDHFTEGTQSCIERFVQE